MDRLNSSLGALIFLLCVFPFVIWGAGSAYIFSPLCTDIATCDSGGFFAFSVKMTILSVMFYIGNAAIWLFLSRKP